MRAAVGCSDRANSAASQLKKGDIDWEKIFGRDGICWLHTGGILAALSETTPDVILEAVAAAMKHGTIVSYDLNYRNHRMDHFNIPDIKGRFIFLFRLLKVDTLLCYDPWGHYEENPDHYVTARAVEAARWMAGMGTDYPEHLEVVEPHTVREMYYFARGPQMAEEGAHR